MALRTDSLLHYANQLNNNPDYGQEEPTLLGWPQVVRLKFSGAHPGAFLDVLLQENIYGDAVQYCERFPHLTHLVWHTDRQLVLLDLLSHCFGLRSLKLVINPNRFLLSQHFKADAGPLSLGLHFYLRDLCPLTELAVSFADGSSLSSMVNTFETNDDADSLPIRSFVFADNFPVSGEVIANLQSEETVDTLPVVHSVVTAKIEGTI
ncbi:hypothetical protein MBANPS3_003301 [Mucor bainieri]